MPSGMMRSGWALVPLLEEPVVPGPDARHARAPRSLALEEHPAAESGDLRREVHRRPDPVDVHVPHPGVDVVAAGTHLVEAERLEPARSPAAGRPRRSSRPGCSAGPRTPRPGGPAGSPRSAAPVGQAAGHAALERVGRLDDVVVHRDDGHPDVPGLGLRQEEGLVQGGDLGHDLLLGPPAPDAGGSILAYACTTRVAEGRRASSIQALFRRWRRSSPSPSERYVVVALLTQGRRSGGRSGSRRGRRKAVRHHDRLVQQHSDGHGPTPPGTGVTRLALFTPRRRPRPRRCHRCSRRR